MYPFCQYSSQKKKKKTIHQGRPPSDTIFVPSSAHNLHPTRPPDDAGKMAHSPSLRHFGKLSRRRTEDAGGKTVGGRMVEREVYLGDGRRDSVPRSGPEFPACSISLSALVRSECAKSWRTAAIGCQSRVVAVHALTLFSFGTGLYIDWTE